MDKQEILNQIGDLANLARVVERKRRIEVPFYKINSIEEIAAILLPLGFTQGAVNFYKRFSADSAESTLKQKYEEMNETEQIQADLVWIGIGGWVNDEKLSRLHKAGYNF